MFGCLTWIKWLVDVTFQNTKLIHLYAAMKEPGCLYYKNIRSVFLVLEMSCFISLLLFLMMNNPFPHMKCCENKTILVRFLEVGKFWSFSIFQLLQNMIHSTTIGATCLRKNQWWDALKKRINPQLLFSAIFQERFHSKIQYLSLWKI